VLAKQTPKPHVPEPYSRRTVFGLAAGGVIAALEGGCGLPDRGPAVPRGRETAATVLGIPNERFYPMAGTGPLEAEFEAAMQRQRRALGLTADALLPEMQLLSLSGGGENGAFGAGLLCGWSEHQTRPGFDLVTGVSTGGLIAPFAYLGRDYDPQLRALYLETMPSQVLSKRIFTAALFDDALTDNDPLFRTVCRYVNEGLLPALAKAYGQGRLLLIASTDLDAQQRVIWNVGAIAASGHPRALDTIRRLMIASAAIPGQFPPTMFDVTLDGKTYQEMHVDGGMFTQLFLYPSALTRHRREHIKRGEPVLPATAYIIRNGRLDPEWVTVQRRTMSITVRSIYTLIGASAYDDVLRVYTNTQRDGVGFNLAYVGSDFSEALPQPFDPGYIHHLFDYGYQRGRRGYDWTKVPPL